MIILLFYVGLCFLLIPGIKIRREKKSELLTKQDSNFIKGLAAVGVLLAHIQDFLEVNVGMHSLFLRPFSFLGGMGVLLFFFISGYGIFLGYAKKPPTIRYWKNRITKVLLPALVITILTVISCYALEGRIFTGMQFLTDLLTSQWYIVVAMLMYLVFFFSWAGARGNMPLLLLLDGIGSILVLLLFYFQGLPSRWYNGLLLFPAGMLVAWMSEKILCLGRKWHVLGLILSALLFAITGVVYARWKGTIPGNGMKTVSGICLGLMIVFLVQLFEVGNRSIRWIGERSLYVYLCHVGILSLASILVLKTSVFGEHQEVWVLVILSGTWIYTAIAYAVAGKLGKLCSSNPDRSAPKSN